MPYSVAARNDAARNDVSVELHARGVALKVAQEVARGMPGKLAKALREGLRAGRKEEEGEILRLERWVADLESGMYINCVYCGHRYGPREGTPVAMADVLKEHIEVCPKHPAAALKKRVAELEAELTDVRRDLDMAIDVFRQVERIHNWHPSQDADVTALLKKHRRVSE
jgi:polyhydroxyalkanoate synthesis regulator phasin